MSLKRIETDNLELEGKFSKQPDKYCSLVNVAVELSIVYLFVNFKPRLWWATEARLSDLFYIFEIGYNYIVIIEERSLENIRSMLESGYPIYDLYVNLHPNHVWSIPASCFITLLLTLAAIISYVGSTTSLPSTNRICNWCKACMFIEDLVQWEELPSLVRLLWT